MKFVTALFVGALGLASAGSTLPAQAAGHKTKKVETQADLMKEARISMDSARAIALAKVPGATVKSGEIERENGRLIYSFDLETSGRSGIDEVNVNALTGKIVGKVQHEGPKTERKEARQEARERAKK